MVTEPTEPASPVNAEEVTTPPVKSREEINALKAKWRDDGTWDLYETPGFEAHYEELRMYQELYFAEQDAVIDAERQALYEERQAFMKGCGLNQLQEVTVRLVMTRIGSTDYRWYELSRRRIIDESVRDALYLLRQTTPEYLLPLSEKPPASSTAKATPNPSTVKLGGTYTAIVVEPVNGLVKLEDSGQSAFLPYTEIEGMREGQRILVSVVAFTAKGLIIVSREDAQLQIAVELGEEPQEPKQENLNG